MRKRPSRDSVDSIAQLPRERLSPITAGACKDKELHVLLARIRALDVTVVNPLLMSLFEDYRDGALSHDDLASILRTAESYLFRRAACDVATNSPNKFFSSVIARLATVWEDGGDIREAFEAILLGEEGTARRIPSDTEFERALRTRDCYAFKRGVPPAHNAREQLAYEGPAGLFGRHLHHRAHHAVERACQRGVARGARSRLRARPRGACEHARQPHAHRL